MSFEDQRYSRFRPFARRKTFDVHDRRVVEYGPENASTRVKYGIFELVR